MKKHTLLDVWMVIVMLFSSLALSPAMTAPSLAEATSSIHYAQPDGVKEGVCLSWENACDLQYTLGIVENGDQVWVMEGIYYPGVYVADTFTLKDGVTLYGGFPPGGGYWEQRNWIAFPTILSGDIDHNDLTESGVVTDTVNISGTNAFHVVNIAWLASTILDGFIITAGNANDSEYPYNDGGGLYNNNGSVTLNNVTFSGNIAFVGGGMTNVAGTATLTDVTFTSNQASWSSGGMANCGTVSLTDVIFNSNNGSTNTGGMSNDGTAVLTNVTFSSNLGGGLINAGFALLKDVTFLNNWNTSMGGGMWNANNGAAVLNNVTFTGNTSSDGGGMTNNWGTVELTDVTFSGNTATSRGGGMFIADTTKLTNVTFSNNQSYQDGGGIYYIGSNLALTNVTFAGNSAVFGGGLYNFASSPTLTNVTFFGNSAKQNGGGIGSFEYSSVGSLPILTNTILWQNSPDQIYNDDLCLATVTYSDIQGGWYGEGNIDLDPLLGPLADNGGFTLTYALGAGSPAIDTGSPTTCPPTDPRGVARPVDGDGDGTAVCDMGTYEYIHIIAWLYLPVVEK